MPRRKPESRTEEQPSVARSSCAACRSCVSPVGPACATRRGRAEVWEIAPLGRRSGLALALTFPLRRGREPGLLLETPLPAALSGALAGHPDAARAAQPCHGQGRAISRGCISERPFELIGSRFPPLPAGRSQRGPGAGDLRSAGPERRGAARYNQPPSLTAINYKHFRCSDGFNSRAAQPSG